MSDTLKILGQVKPNATTLTTLYTVPGATSALATSIVVCNQSAVETKFRVSIAVAAAADNTKQYLYYDAEIAGNDTFIATMAIGMETTDLVRVYATLATLSFTLLGMERT